MPIPRGFLCSYSRCVSIYNFSFRFGATALALNLVPIVGLFFNITSTIGAALWANNLEKTGAAAQGTGRKVDRVGQSAHDIQTRDQYEVRLED